MPLGEDFRFCLADDQHQRQAVGNLEGDEALDVVQRGLDGQGAGMLAGFYGVAERGVRQRPAQPLVAVRPPGDQSEILTPQGEQAFFADPERGIKFLEVAGVEGREHDSREISLPVFEPAAQHDDPAPGNSGLDRLGNHQAAVALGLMAAEIVAVGNIGGGQFAGCIIDVVTRRIGHPEAAGFGKEGQPGAQFPLDDLSRLAGNDRGLEAIDELLQAETDFFDRGVQMGVENLDQRAGGAFRGSQFTLPGEVQVIGDPGNQTDPDDENRQYLKSQLVPVHRAPLVQAKTTGAIAGTFLFVIAARRVSGSAQAAHCLNGDPGFICRLV